MEIIGSRDNPLLVKLRKLSKDGAGYRRLGQAWIEGDHLCAALRARGRPAALAVVSESGWRKAELRELACWAPKQAVVQDLVFRSVSELESPSRIGFVIDLTAAPGIDLDIPSVVLDRLQDAGNVGSILRSAAAFGFGQVLAVKGTAALWSPKVLRAGMGAHFALHLVEGLSVDEVQALRVALVATSSHAGADLPRAALPQPCAWVLGHEGQGVSQDLLARCALTVRIPQPGGEESLNVAAAAAVCLYESARRAAQ